MLRLSACETMQLWYNEGQRGGKKEGEWLSGKRKGEKKREGNEQEKEEW